MEAWIGFWPREGVSGTYWIGVWVGPRSGVGFWGRKISFALSGNQTQVSSIPILVCKGQVKGKAFPLQAWAGSYSSRRLRL